MNIKTNVVKEVTLETVKKMAQAAEEKAEALGVPIVFAAVDAGGNLMLLHRMEKAFFTSVEIAINKAFTSAALRIGTDQVAPLVQPGESLYGLQLTNDCKIVPFGGGFPIKVDGEVVGAIGVSGGSVEEDMAIASHAMHI
ncbi:MAG: heme-binding protein [Clostridiaceae bacterium]|nr:heme-binding protein [Clostridiaceae bacterium]